MDVAEKFWNVFKFILESIGRGGLENAASESAVMSLFMNILMKLGYAMAVIEPIMSFIQFALNLYNLFKDFMNGSQLSMC